MKKVALVGMAQNTRHLAPWDDESVEIWTLNESPSERFGYVTRVSRHFQLHPLWNCMREMNQNDPEHAQWLRSRKPPPDGFPIYMQDYYEEIPASVKYPIEEVFGKFEIPLDKPDHWREFTNTFPYMLALALYEEFDEIGIYGFEMGSETEYAYQRPAVHLWLGIARGLYLANGKPAIHIPDNSELLGIKTVLYGYDQVLNLNPMAIEIDRNKFAADEEFAKGKMNEIQGRQQALQEELMKIKARFDERAKKIAEKRIDDKLKQRRLRQIDKEFQEATQSIREEVARLENIKMDTYGQLNHAAGAKQIAQKWIDQHNNQRPQKIAPPPLVVRRT